MPRHCFEQYAVSMVLTKVVVFEVLPNQWLTGITTGKTFLLVKHGKTEFLKKMCGKY